MMLVDSDGGGWPDLLTRYLGPYKLLLNNGSFASGHQSSCNTRFAPTHKAGHIIIPSRRILTAARI
jgi:hypothetical protein